MKNDICTTCMVNCVDVDNRLIRCPVCRIDYVRASVSDFEYPSASFIPRAWNPIMGASSVDQIQKLLAKGYEPIRRFF